MEKKQYLRRTVLNLTGSLCALGVTGAAAKNYPLPPGRDWCLDSDALQLPHRESTAVDNVAIFSQGTLTNDLATIMSHYSRWDVNEVFLWANPDGTLTLRTTASLTEAQQRWINYLGRARYPGGERRNCENAGRWFDLIDSQYYQIDTSTGTESVSRAAFLFITWPDGVIGQMYWPQPSWTPAFDVRMPQSLMKMLVAYENAWKAGDVDGRLALVEDQTTCSVIRTASVSSSARHRFIAKDKASLRAAWTSESAGRVVELERMYQVVSTFYVSAGYRLVLDVAGRRVVRETVMLLPLGPNRKFVGELSYSLES